jgi:hypothetical protein
VNLKICETKFMNSSVERKKNIKGKQRIIPLKVD